MARKLEVEIVGDASSLHRALGKADSSSKSFGKTLGGLGKAGAAGIAVAGIAGITYALKTGIGEYQQSQKVAAQTNAVIKSTGGVANVTAKQVSDLATQIMKKTGIDDEQIAASENMLLTFKDIRNEVGKGNDIFNQATHIVTDMSVAFGTDASKSAIQLGKALNDPIKGITALSKIGVTFTEGQKKQIKALVESGKTMQAQKIILHELQTEVGGSAEALGKTLPGQINIAKETFTNFMGELVAKAIPTLQKTISWLRDHWPEINKQIKDFWAGAQPVLVGFGQIITQVALLFRKHWGTIGPIVQNLANIVKVNLQIMGASLKFVAALLRGDWAGAWKQIREIVNLTIEAIKQRLLLAKNIFGPLAQAIGSGIKRGVMAGLEGIGGAAWNLINNIGSVIASKAGAIAGWGMSIGRHLLSGIISGLAGLGSRLVALIKSAVNALIDRINSALTFHFTIPIPFHKDATIGHTSNIPHLAAGGIVTGPTVAMIGERGPEAVIPLGGSGALQLTNVIQVDGETLWRTTQKYALRDLARGGGGLSPA